MLGFGFTGLLKLLSEELADLIGVLGDLLGEKTMKFCAERTQAVRDLATVQDAI
jgi:hypothetical protein